MTTAAKITFRNELWMGPAGGSLTKIAELRSVTPPKGSRETLDATTHDSEEGAMEFIASGVYDPGTLNYSVNHIAGSASDTALTAAFNDGELRDFKVVLKGASDTVDYLFSGFVTAHGPDDQPTNGLQTASGTVRVSGPVTTE
jgi:predicted secreted protein